MNIKSFFGIKVRISIPMLIFGLVWILSGNGTVFLTVCFTVLLHETFHAVTARILGLEVNEIVLYPFGGGVSISELDDFCEKEIIVSFAGPLLSAFSGLAWNMCVNAHLLPQWHEFVSYSYSIAFFNLLPVYPLDGGRIIDGILSSLFNNKGRKIGRILSVVFSAVFFGYSLLKVVFYSNYSYAIIGVFVLASAVLNLRDNRSFFRKNKNSNKIGLVLAKKNESLIDVYKRFYGDNYGIAVVIDGDGKIERMIGQDEILNELVKDSRSKA